MILIDDRVPIRALGATAEERVAEWLQRHRVSLHEPVPGPQRSRIGSELHLHPQRVQACLGALRRERGIVLSPVAVAAYSRARRKQGGAS